MRTSLIFSAAGWIACAFGMANAAVNSQPTKEQTAFFDSKVRPILEHHCYKCHSLAENKSKGGLTLDTRQGWQKGGDGGAVIEPGSPDASSLIKAIRYTDPDLQMPPKGEKLSAAQIATLTEWVKMGAPDPRDGGKDIATKLTGLTDQARHHWAYQPVLKPAVPNNKGQAWCRTPVDAFVLQQLEANGMAPNKAASKEALIRRAYYDLIGLPPTPYEVADFLRDTSPDAFAKVVDRLLASPHYGERWGRFWLDTARYADTRGGEMNNNNLIDYRYPNAWTYRDYVIKSFNDDKPFDQFIKEQLAADLLPGTKQDDPRMAALGFLTIGQGFAAVNDRIDEQIDTVTKGFLGLTVSCARCHDHMFDPIPQKDYYALHGVFANIQPTKNVPEMARKIDPEKRAEFAQKHAALLAEMRGNYLSAVDFYLRDFWAKPEGYLRAALFLGGKGKGGEKERNASIAKYDLDEQFANFFGRNIQTNPNVWGSFLRFRSTGEFVVRDNSRAAQAMKDRARKIAANSKNEKAKGRQARVAEVIEEEEKQGVNKLLLAAYEKSKPKTEDEVIKFYIDLLQSQREKAKGFTKALEQAASVNVPEYSDDLIDLLRGPFLVKPAAQLTEDYVREDVRDWPARMRARSQLNLGVINLLETSHPGAPAKPMAVKDVPNPKDSPLLIRGEAQSKGAIVPRGFLEILSPGRKALGFTQGSGRLQLAQAIADKNNPLTARVAVNRIWMHHFGEGLVPTPDNLGVQSGKPVNPALLDYLAAKFVEFGWSTKQMHRLIMLSAVYQQSTETNAAYETKDPDNKLLWRANIRRLDFEAVRDSLLIFTGQLDREMGGKPVNITDEPYSYRRSVYGYIDRGNLPELMQHFDFSDPDMTNSKRTTTVVPQQALFMMNSAMAVDIARKITARPEIAQSTVVEEKVRWYYRILFQRMPRAEEIQFAQAFLAQVRGNDNEGDNQEQPTANEAKKPRREEKKNQRRNVLYSAIQNEGEKVDRHALSAWEAYAQALLFTNELAYVN